MPENNSHKVNVSGGYNNSSSNGENAQTNQIKVPQISLPKGGGAIKGIGEKFAANPVTGTGSMTVPIATSPGRSGFGPQLSLSYDSGSGNGPFGMGWNLSLPSIIRKTDKGLPKYQDEIESDVFILSGAEDLVPVLVKDGDNWILERVDNGQIRNVEYRIKRYRPRIEGLFARIERWTNIKDSNEIIWRSISKDNITTWYGITENSRIQYKENEFTKIFSWLICESYDDKGNAIIYDYEKDPENINKGSLNEYNRASTANRYLKRIKYGNKASRLVQPDLTKQEWFFEVVFDYGEGHYTEEKADIPDKHDYVSAVNTLPENVKWPVRPDPFSSYRAGFEVRTYRLCQRVLMFHHFKELESPDYLVRSTEFNYKNEENSSLSFIQSVVQSGYVYSNGKYLKKSLPPLEFEYSKVKIDHTIRELDKESLENLPVGLDGSQYQFADIDGEGIPGIFTEQAGDWFYKPALGNAQFAPMQMINEKPSVASLHGGWQFLDLAGDGKLDVADFSGTVTGFYERNEESSWEPFKAFKSLPNIDWKNPNLKFIDVNGDGHTDILITEDEQLVWYPSLAEDGFAEAVHLRHGFDEKQGPHMVFNDGTQQYYLADMSGDGITDIVRIRNGEVCYWPNLGYAHFGAKVTMDNAPWFDTPDIFNQQRIRLADIDGSGTTDIIYLSTSGMKIYYNQCGNSWKEETNPPLFPAIDNTSVVQVTDLLGNGTACLVWSSPLPENAQSPVKFIDLMGGKKPHLLLKTINNLGAETSVQYASSTKFYLEDKKNGKQWITRLAFPVHVVERVKTHDCISNTLFVTRYAYHHGYFDGFEREFRGFGMVEQWDTEDYEYDPKTAVNNQNPAFDLPPIHTKTWFHTGAYLDGTKISRHFEEEYFKEPGKTEQELRELLLPDTIITESLSVNEITEACRALKGSILRQEIYSDDARPKSKYPYTVSERNYVIKRIQPLENNKHGVFFIHPNETIEYNYERNPVDPRVGHQLTLQVDNYGNVKKSMSIGYGRRQQIITTNENGNRIVTENPELKKLSPEDRKKQTQILVTYTESDYTKVIDEPDDWRTPLLSEIRNYELTGFSPDKSVRFTWNELYNLDYAQLHEEPYESIITGNVKQKRLIERVRTLYYKDDLSGPLPKGDSGNLALPFETYKQAFTPGLLTKVYGSKLSDHQIKRILQNEGKYLDLSNDGNWWIPSGRQQFNKDKFYLPVKFIDPFGHEYQISYDDYSLLMVTTIDPLGNTVKAGNNYRVLQPWKLKDPNENRSELRFDALGMATGTAVMGKETETIGDQFNSFKADLTISEIAGFLADPKGGKAIELLDGATTRIIYDLHNYWNNGKPVFSATIARENHVSELDGEAPKIQVSFSYSDGFGREIQKKIQAEQGKVPKRDNDGNIAVKPNRKTEMIDNLNPYRWVGNGWTVFNNKGKPVKQFEPFFSDTFEFDSNVQIGVSPILIYDHAERVIATLHPNHTYEKVVFDAWKQTTYDVNDTVLLSPATDPDIGDFVKKLDASAYSPTWYKVRTDDNLLNGLWADKPPDIKNQLIISEKQAATKTAKHADTPSTAYLDSLGRVFLTIEHNRFDREENNRTVPKNEFYQTLVEMDIEGNQRSVTDAKNRVVMRYDYYMVGPEKDQEGTPNLIHQHSMEAGERWMLNNVAGKLIYLWNSRNFRTRTEYDELNRPKSVFMQEGDKPEIMTECLVYGEYHNDRTLNLRTKLYKHFDQSGVITNACFDFKGNLLEGKRQFANIYKEYINWNNLYNITDVDEINTKSASFLENEEFTSFTRYDAWNRPTQLVTPHTPGIKPNIIQPGYNDANLLERIDVWIRCSNAPASLLNTDDADQHMVTNIDYNAKGQREKINYGNNSVTSYEYEFETFRLHNLQTKRSNDSVTAEPIQAIYYTYDPSGNITHIQDNAQQTYFFKNYKVKPHCDYLYDAIYRLIEATGREHVGQTGSSLNNPVQPNHDDSFRINHPHLHDGNAMDNYTENYEYDEVGNIINMIHQAGNGGWKRHYQYTETSLLENGKISNRLSAISMPGDNETGPYHGKYTYDAHGNMTTMPHLHLLKWDYKDQLTASSKQVVNSGTPETTWYVYDSSNQRVRKITESQATEGNAPKKLKERYYLGPFEIYREYDTSETKTLERESLSVMDSLSRDSGNKARVALIETQTYKTGVLNRIRNMVSSPTSLYRFQYNNHLGSACLELDEKAAFISYEEFYPYGNISFQSVDSQREIPAKRYRYTGKERDEENGLDYYGARYYASWLGRWCSPDPCYIKAGINIYSFVHDNSICRKDAIGLQDAPTEEINITLTIGEVTILPTDEEDDFAADYYLELFQIEVGSLEDPNPPPATAGEKSVDQDVLTLSHDEAVIKVINTALESSIQMHTDIFTGEILATKREIISDALQLVIGLRHNIYKDGQCSLENSQNLIFRDADHYFSAWIQEWQSYPKTPDILKRMCEEVPQECAILLSNMASQYYDSQKRDEYSKLHPLSTEGIPIDTSDIPSSAPGGRHWAELGKKHFLRDSFTMETNSEPSLLTETTFQIRVQEQLRHNQMNDVIRRAFVPGGR